MLIGRIDDPRNPRKVVAFEVSSLFGSGSRNPIWTTGRNAASKEAEHTTAFAPVHFFLPQAPCTEGAIHTRPMTSSKHRERRHRL